MDPSTCQCLWPCYDARLHIDRRLLVQVAVYTSWSLFGPSYGMLVLFFTKLKHERQICLLYLSFLPASERACTNSVSSDNYGLKISRVETFKHELLYFCFEISCFDYLQGKQSQTFSKNKDSDNAIIKAHGWGIGDQQFIFKAPLIPPKNLAVLPC